MATLATSELEIALQKLDLDVPIPQFTAADVLNKPLDLIRSYLANILVSLVEADRIAAYNSIALSSDPLHGDLTVVLPRLCPGTKAGSLANDLIKKVRITWSCALYALSNDYIVPNMFTTRVSRRRRCSFAYMGEGSDTSASDLALYQWPKSTVR